MLLCVDAAADAATPWEEMLDALDAVSPSIDDVRPGLAFLDMHGIAGVPQLWMAQTRKALHPFAVAPQLGVAANKFCARAASYAGDGTICPAGNERTFLAPLPLELLEIEPDTCARLRLLGVDRLGDLARLPHGPFVRRFGPQAASWHQWARGEDSTPFVPRGHAVAIEASIFGEGRTEDETQVLFALRVLLSRIGADLERCGKRAGSLQLDVELEDAAQQRFEIVLASPTSQERSMLDVVRAKLEGATFSAPIVGLRLRAGRLEEGGEATALFVDSDYDAEAIAVAISRLESLIGEPVRKANTRDAHTLEERFSYETFTPPRAQAKVAERATSAPSQTLVPQLRLLSVREIDVRVRRGEPAEIRSNGEPARAVMECAGPWRVEVGWFSNAPVARDEYDVLLDDGELYRIYRQGDHWYLRGAYD